MRTKTTLRRTDGPSLRPRIVDVSDVNYDTVTSMVDPADTVYFERKAGKTNLLVR